MNLKKLNLDGCTDFEEIFLVNLGKQPPIPLAELSLKNMNKLKRLRLDNSNVTKIEQLENCIELETLHLPNEIDKLSLKNLRKIKSLQLGLSKVTEIEGLEDCTALVELDLKDTPLNKLSLKSMTNLEKLSLPTSVQSLVLEDLDNIKELDFSGLTHLKEIRFSGSFKALTQITFNEEHDLILSGLEELKTKKNQDQETLKIITPPKRIASKDIEELEGSR